MNKENKDWTPWVFSAAFFAITVFMTVMWLMSVVDKNDSATSLRQAQSDVGVLLNKVSDYKGYLDECSKANDLNASKLTSCNHELEVCQLDDGTPHMFCPSPSECQTKLTMCMDVANKLLESLDDYSNLTDRYKRLTDSYDSSIGTFLDNTKEALK